MKTTTTLFVLILATLSMIAQVSPSDTTTKSFEINLEFRPRTEYRNGYRLLRNDSTHAAFFTEQRSRLNLHFEMEKFAFHTSIQDVRIWGEQNPRSTTGTLQIFEAFVEPRLGNYLSFRIGKQMLKYDNERLFAQNNWRQNAGTHDGVRIMFNRSRAQIEIFAAYNQESNSQEKFFETDYSPSFSNYKALFVNFLYWQPTKTFTLTSITASDVFQSKTNHRIDYYRITSGGRLEYIKGNFYATVSAYYQGGANNSFKKINAYYIQPELKYDLPKYFTFKLGAEVLSGDNAANPNNVSNSFDPLYGVNHKFLGSMDYFIKFPVDLNNAGLIAPYLFINSKLSDRITIRTDAHLFYMENNFIVSNNLINRYLGFENDLLLILDPNNYTNVHLGYSYGLFTKSMEAMRGSGNASLWQHWAFIMITFTPTIFHWQG